MSIFRPGRNLAAAAMAALTSCCSVSARAEPSCPGGAVTRETFAETRKLLCAEPRKRHVEIITGLSYADGSGEGGSEAPVRVSAKALLHALNAIEVGNDLPDRIWEDNLAPADSAILRTSLRIALLEAAFPASQIEQWCTAPSGPLPNAPSYFGDIEYAIRCGR